MKLLRFLLSCTKSQIEALLRDSNAPLFIVSLIRAIMTDLQNDKVDTVNRLFDRVYGKTFASTEISITEKSSFRQDRPMCRKDYEKLLNDLKE
jgi:hypothetical protein